MGKKPGASKPKGGDKAGSSKVASVLAATENSTAGGKRPASAEQPASPEVPSQLPKKSKTNEIDDIFSKKPVKDKHGDSSIKDGAGPSRQQQQVAAEPPRAAATVMGSKDDLFGADGGKSRKRTEEGFTIYSENELGLNRKGGGDTDLCPFDCDCCY